MNHRVPPAFLALTFSLGIAFALATPKAAHATDPDVKRLMSRVDDLFRSTGSKATLSMHVKAKYFERTMRLEAYSKGTEKSLMRILSPAKEKGVTTLKVGENLWNYLPKVDRTIKVPASMMSGSWMGSHFTNDDLVRESRFDEDFASSIIGRPEGKPGKRTGEWVIELIPREDTAVVWGKIVTHIDAASELPTKVLYYDEKGALIRTLTYDQVKEFSGRMIPARMTLTPEGKPGEFTEVIYEALELDYDVPERFFSKSMLTR